MQAMRHQKEAHPPPRRPLKALIVEDVPSDAELLLHELGRAGFAVPQPVMSDLDEFHAALEQESWELVIADYWLPGFTALDVVCAIERRGLDLPVIVVSGVIEEEVAVELMKAGARDFVSKENLARLGSAISRELEGASSRQQLREALAALVKGERQLRALIEQMPAMLWTTDQDLVITSVTGAALGVLGVGSSVIVGRVVSEVLEWLPLSGDIERAHREALAGGHPTYESKLAGLTLEARLEPLFDISGKPNGVIGVALDISKRTQALEQVQRSEREYQALAENSPDIIERFDRRLRKLYVNRVFKEMHGIEPGDAIGKTNRELGMPEPVVSLFEEALRRTLAGVPQQIEFQRATPTGQRWLESRFAPEQLVETETALVITRDVTDERRVQEVVRQSEQQFRALFETALDAIVTLDDEGRLIDVNPAACELFGRTREELLELPAEALVPEEARAKLARNFAEFLALGQIHEERVYLHSSGKRRIVDVSARANFLPGRHLAILRDVGERKQLQAQLLQAQKMEAVGTLAGGVAHNFNNLLTGIMGYAELILAKSHQPTIRKDAEEIKRAASRGAEVTRGLLAFSRREQGQGQRLNVGVVVLELMDLLKQLIGAAIEIETVVHPHVADTEASRSQIEQMIVNLVVNARDAMPQGGRLVIVVKNEVVLGRAHHRGGTLEPGHYVTLSIFDDGVGMDEDTLDHIFEPFFTTKGDLGSGLGLSTAFGVAAALGGSIDVESKPGEGTRFTIFFRRCES
ncbi:MAG: PAS domain S-box protein [Gaiellaceae bacterium]